MFKIIVDEGKPYEEVVNSEEQLKIILTDLYHEQKDFDVFVFDGEENDISESQFINEMVGDIMGVD